MARSGSGQTSRPTAPGFPPAAAGGSAGRHFLGAAPQHVPEEGGGRHHRHRLAAPPPPRPPLEVIEAQLGRPFAVAGPHPAEFATRGFKAKALATAALVSRRSSRADPSPAKLEIIAVCEPLGGSDGSSPSADGRPIRWGIVGIGAAGSGGRGVGDLDRFD
jgi:hypothetical protein